MTAIGIDLGGTKIETQVFDDNWSVVARQRCDTPRDYAALVQVTAEQIRWGRGQAGEGAAVGISAAGLINPRDGLALTANLEATGRPLPNDIARAAECDVTYVNDCHALALSEAVFGRGRGRRTVLALVLGTGVGGGIAIDQRILLGPTRTGGEFGHTSAPAHVVAQHDLPVWHCGCGRMGCIETYISGPGLARLAKHITGQDMTPPQIAAARAGAMAKVWQVWCDLTADLLHRLTLVADPDLMVLGGGLSRIAGIVDDLSAAVQRVQFAGFCAPALVLAEGGDTSGARGAAYAAWQAQHDA